MKKYYIEVGDMESPCEYIMQSRWFDTEQEALDFARKIIFLDKQYSINLMSAIWSDEDEECCNDIYYDINFVRYLDKELKL